MTTHGFGVFPDRSVLCKNTIERGGDAGFCVSISGGSALAASGDVDGSGDPGHMAPCSSTQPRPGRNCARAAAPPKSVVDDLAARAIDFRSKPQLSSQDPAVACIISAKRSLRIEAGDEDFRAHGMAGEAGHDPLRRVRAAMATETEPKHRA